MTTITAGLRRVILAWAAVSPLGIGRPAFTAGLRAGPAASPPPQSAAVGQVRLVPDFEVRKLLGRKGTRSMDRATGLAVTAAGQLLADDRVAGRDRVGENTGLVLGTSTGSAQSIMDFTRDSLVGARPFFVDPARFPNTVMNCAAGQCAIWHQLKGPNTTIAGGRVTGLHALQYALRLRKSGHADSVLCGAVEECSDARAWLERHSRGPEAAGTVLGEGCAMLLLGPAGGDSGDGADGLAEVLTLAFGVWHQESDIAPALAACVRRALKAAQAEPARVWAVSASGLPGALGAHEEAALADVFGTHRPERVRCSELIGETSAASAAFQVAAVLATAETHGDASGQIVLVTSFDHDGGIGCALMRLLLPRLNGRTKMTSVVPEVRTQHGQTILERIVAIPEGTWWSCQACQAVLHHSQVRRHQGVCPECGHHARLTAPERIGQLADPDSFTEYDAELAAVDQLGFVDQMPYPQRLAKARKVTALTEAAVTGTATFGGRPAVLVVLDFGFLGGSMGTVVGEKVTRAAKLALDRRVPLVTVSASGGARMQEGVLSLTQMAKTAAAIGRLREAGVPFLSVLTDPVYGGVAASFAALGDIILAESGTRASFAGRQVIEQTSRQKLPDGFQTASFMYEHGHIDLVLDRAKLAEALRQLIAFCADAAHPTRPRAAAACGRAPRTGGDAWETVRLARAVGRPNALAYIDWLFSRFIPLSGDRWSGDDQAVIGGLAWLGETPLMLLAHCKGTNVAENVRRNFGMPHPAGYPQRHAAGAPGRAAQRPPGHAGGHARRVPGAAFGGGEPERRDRRDAGAVRKPAHADRDRGDRRRRQRRCARAGHRGPAADAGEQHLLCHQPRRLRDDPVRRREPGARGGAGVAAGRCHAGPAGHRRRDRARAVRRRASGRRLGGRVHRRGAAPSPDRAAGAGYRGPAEPAVRPAAIVRHGRADHP